MKTIIYQGAMIWFILIVLISILNFMAKKTFYDREKNSPFECGFNPTNSARVPFSLQFFLITMIFVIFDVELTLLLPSIFIMKISSVMNFSISLGTFIIILLFGIFHEQYQGSLNWMN